MRTGLNGVDLAVIVVYLLGVTAFGLRFRRHQRTLKDYFLADQAIPWWALSLSIVAAETSTLTIISVPGLAYETDFRFLQLVLGYVVGRIIVSFLLIPQYFRGELLTAYQLIDRRFGLSLRSLTAGLFLMTRAAAEGVRVYAVAIVVAIALSSLLSGHECLRPRCLRHRHRDSPHADLHLRRRHGRRHLDRRGATRDLRHRHAGRLVHHLPSPARRMEYGPQHRRASRQVPGLRLHWNFYATYTFWSGLIGGAFLTTASHGTDQLIVQRLLAARNERQSKIALISSGFAVLAQFGFSC